MKIALAQISTTIGDFDGNVRKILEWTDRAKELGASVVLFPEMATTGYPPRDLLDRHDFVAFAQQAARHISDRTKGITSIVGSVAENDEEFGKPLDNVAIVSEEGKIQHTYAKCLLPTYDVFDETRYFEPNKYPQPLDVAGIKSAVSICEDIWDDPVYAPTRRYGTDPVGKMIQSGAKIVLNISASPFNVGKMAIRHKLLAGIASKHQVPVCYVNMVGGNDELVFDGNSMVFDQVGRLIATGKPFEEDLIVVDLEASNSEVPWEREDIEDVFDALVLGLKDYIRKCKFSSVVLGLSGGIDSAVTAAIAAIALGPKNVLGVSLPSRFTAGMSREDARSLAANLGIAFEEIPIRMTHEALLSALHSAFHGKAEDTTEENLQSRIRGTMLMALSNKHGHLLLSTGNKSEMAVGYCTLYGDMNGGLALISDVPKTMVYDLARWINKRENREVIPERTITRAPSAELRDNQTDQDSLPPYDVLDKILDLYVVRHYAVSEILEETKFELNVVTDVIRRIEVNEFKRRQAPPGIRVTGKAFGMGRRNPIARTFR